MTQSTTSRRGSHAVLVASGILLSRLFGFVREALVAKYFGVGAHADVYGTAFRAPNLLQNLLGEQTLSAAFIPIYSRLLAAGRERDAGRFAGAIFGLLLAVAAALSLAGVLLARPIVTVFAAGFVNDAAEVAAGTLVVDRFALAVRAVQILFPMAGILVLSAWSLGVLNSHRRFFLPYVAPVLWNSAIITALLWIGESLARGGELLPGQKTTLFIAACWGALAGGALQFAIQLPVVARVLRGFRPALSLRVVGVREALSAFGPVVAGRGVVQLSSYLEFFLASFLAGGAVAALLFAQRLYVLPVALFALSVAAAELPELSRLTGEAHGARLARVDSGLRQTAFLTVPTVVGYLAFGLLIISAIYRRGSFGVPDTWLVYLVLIAYTVGLLPTTASRLLQNVFYSLGDTRFPAVVAVARVTLGVLVGGGLMLWLDRISLARWVAAEGTPLRLGALGLAIGSAVGAWVEGVLLVRGLKRRLPGCRLPLAGYSRMLALALGAAAPAALLWRLLPDLPALLGAPAVVGLFALVYLGGSLVLRFPEGRAWLGRLR